MKKYSVNNAPLYQNVKNILLEAIRSKEIGDNGRLPSEGALSDQFNVSRATIRSALQSLENDGVITKRHGSGTVVNPEGLQVKMRIDEFKGFFQLIIDSGHDPSISEKNLIPMEANEKLAKLLNINKGEQVLLLQRLFLGDGKPVIYASEYIPTCKFVNIPTVEEVPESIFDLTDTFCTEGITHSITEIRSAIADPDLRKKMNLERNETLIRLEELHYAKQSEPIAFSEILVRDKLIRFHTIRRR